MNIGYGNALLTNQCETVGTERRALDAVQGEVFDFYVEVGLKVVVVGLEAGGVGVPRCYWGVFSDAVVED